MLAKITSVFTVETCLPPVINGRDISIMSMLDKITSVLTMTTYLPKITSVFIVEAYFHPVIR